MRLEFFPIPTLEGLRFDLIIELALPRRSTPKIKIEWSSTIGATVPDAFEVQLPHHHSSLQLIGPLSIPGVTYTATITSPTHPELNTTITKHPFDRIAKAV